MAQPANASVNASCSPARTSERDLERQIDDAGAICSDFAADEVGGQ
jgi:hypothetical protein